MKTKETKQKVVFDKCKIYKKGAARKYRYILELEHNEVMDLFLKSDQYCTFVLPEYFCFDDILDYARKTIGEKKYDECLRKSLQPESLDDVNLNITLNKDGHYAVRPLTLANPYLYYFLVRELCNEKGWNAILNCFKKFRIPHITAVAIPVVRRDIEAFHNSTTILNWWENMEQRSIELSLEYKYMFVTDITNCYGSINPQSFDLAFGMKGTKYETTKNKRLSANVQKYLGAIQKGRNMGIPQGSALFDFLAEFLLGYVDLLLYDEIKKQMPENLEYEMLRYRDDYRIFCNDKGKLEDISFILQDVLSRLDFRMNGQKTFISDSIVTDSIKPDKRYYISNTPIFRHIKEDDKKVYIEDFASVEKFLLYILMFGRKFPNSGQLKVMLSHLNERIKAYQNILPGGNIKAMIAVAVQIAMENAAAVANVLELISSCVAFIKDEEKKKYIVNKVRCKLMTKHKNMFDEIWLQRLTYQFDKESQEMKYDLPLCRFVAGDAKESLWNNMWLKSNLTREFPLDKVVDREKLQTITPQFKLRKRISYDCDIEELNLDDIIILVEDDEVKVILEPEIKVIKEDDRISEIEKKLENIVFPDD